MMRKGKGEGSTTKYPLQSGFLVGERMKSVGPSTHMEVSLRIRESIRKLCTMAAAIKHMDGREIQESLLLAESAMEYASLIHCVVDPGFAHADNDLRKKAIIKSKEALKTMHELIESIENAPYGTGRQSPPLKDTPLGEVPSDNVIQFNSRAANGGGEPPVSAAIILLSFLGFT